MRWTPAEALEFLMERNGLTQSELAKLSGVDQGVLSLCLSGKRAFSKGAALRLSEHFKVSPALFLKT